MITHSSKPTESGYAQPLVVCLPLILPQTEGSPRRQINEYGALTAVMLGELGLIPAEKPPALAEGQKYGDPQRIDGVVIVASIPKTQEEILEDAAYLIAANLTSIDRACREHLDRAAHWSASAMIDTKARANKPKALAVEVWAEFCWDQFYASMDLLIDGNPLVESMLTYPPCPHSMRSLRAE